MTNHNFSDATSTASTHPESLAAVRLLQGAIYNSDAKPWQLVLSYRSVLEDYFARIGLVLVVDEVDGLAYLRQHTDDERDDVTDSLPRLARRVPLSYDVTLLCVILRDELRRWEDNDLENERCTVTLDNLFELWKTMQPTNQDEVQSRRSLDASMKKLEQMAFVRRFGNPGEYEIRRILKARLPLEKLSALRDQMKASLKQPSTNGDLVGGNSHE